MNKNLFIAILLVCAFLWLGIPSATAVGPNLVPADSQFVIPVTDDPTIGSGSNAGAAVQPATNIQSLDAFSKNVNMGRSGTVAGVYVPNLFAYKIVQQPAGNVTYVSSLRDTATDFGLATQYGTVGLLAHNYLAGALFSKLVIGTEVDVVNGDGAVRRYVVTEVARFQATSPNDPYSSFIDLEKGSQLSSNDLFSRIYMGGNKVVLQTCISANGDASWGRLFVTASPMK